MTLGKKDFILQQRCKSDKGSGWGEALPLPEDLPEIEIRLPRSPLSPGEAPGQTPFTPEQEDTRKWKDRSSVSPVTPTCPPNKRSQVSLEDKLAAAELVSVCTAKTSPGRQGLLFAPEIGFITHVQGQSTPIRHKTSEHSDIDSYHQHQPQEADSAEVDQPNFPNYSDKVLK